MSSEGSSFAGTSPQPDRQPCVNVVRDSSGAAEEAPLSCQLSNLMRNASKRVENAIKKAKQEEKSKLRRGKKALREAEQLLSTEVLLGIAKRRSDVGEIICKHCAKSITLADALPEPRPEPPAKRRRGVRDGVLCIAPAPPSPEAAAVLAIAAEASSACAELVPVEQVKKIVPKHTGQTASDVHRALCSAVGEVLIDQDCTSEEEKQRVFGDSTPRAKRGGVEYSPTTPAEVDDGPESLCTD